MTLALITPPATEPLSIVEAKDHLRVDHDHEDGLIAETLKAARSHVEFASGLKLITQVWRQYEGGFPDGRELPLRVFPVQQVQAVTAFDREGAATVVPQGSWSLIRACDPPTLRLEPDVAMASAANGVEIDIVAGMGDFGVDISDTLKRAILLLTAHWYEFRGAVSPQNQPVSIPPGFDALIASQRRVHL